MSDHDREREGGGLAVLIVGGLLAVLMFACGGGAFFYYRQFSDERARAAIIDEMEYAQQFDSEAAEKQGAIETPAPSAPESPPPTQ